MKYKDRACILCDRRTTLTFHHLIPRKVHRRSRFKKHFTKADLEQGIEICRLCHDGLHRFYDEMTLAKQFNTIDKIIADPLMQKHITWVAKQKVPRSSPQKV